MLVREMARCDAESGKQIIWRCLRATFSAEVLYSLSFSYTSVWRGRFSWHTNLAGGEIGEKDRLRPCPKFAKAGSMLHPIHQLYLKININQSSIWHCLTGKVMDGVFDVSFNCVGSLRHSYSDSGVMPGVKHISGILSHFLGYLFIFRVFNKKISREREK